MKMRKKATWLDVLVIFAIMTTCILLFLFVFKRNQQAAKYGILYHDDEIIATYDLSVDGSFEPDPELFPGLVILVQNKTIRFSENGCPDKVCVHTGFLRDEGTYAICLPYHLKLAVEGEREVDN